MSTITAHTDDRRPASTSAPSLEDARRRIDRIDALLVRLLNERAATALDIGAIKRAAGLPIYVPEREALVLARASGKSRGPLAADAVRRVFRAIIDETRNVEQASHR